MNGPFEQEYRDALDGLRFSDEAKERIMKNLMNQDQQNKKTRRFPVRAVLIAVAACLALVMTAGAVSAIGRQTKAHLISSEEEKQEVLERELVEEGDSVVINGGYHGQEYKSLAYEWEDWWDAYGSMPIIEEVTGTEEDGWTKMRTFLSKTPDFLGAEDVFQKRYLAERLSGFDSLWLSTPWDLTWLEEHYATVPNSPQSCTTIEPDGTMFSVMGEFQGENGAAFRMYAVRYSWPWHDTDYQMTEGYDYTELYQTKDGVEVTVLMATAPSGKSVFWASFFAGYNCFDIEGTQVELDDLHDILDSLKLSNLLDYTPEQ